MLGRAEIFEREPLEYAAARFSWAENEEQAAGDVLRAAVRGAPLPLYFPVGVDDGRRGIAEACGFSLFQEKEGFWWADTGQELPPTGLLRLLPMSLIGRDPFVPLLTRCLTATLDRTDALTLGRHRHRQWAVTFLDHHAQPPDQDSWLYAESVAGEPIGFVGLSRREGDVGTITLVGVLPEQRGHHYVDQLVTAAYRAARARGFAGVLSHVDVANHPMMAAMHRTGARADTHPWHKWLYVVSLGR